MQPTRVVVVLDREGKVDGLISDAVGLEFCVLRSDRRLGETYLTVVSHASVCTHDERLVHAAFQAANALPPVPKPDDRPT